jgi:hypothetical protein
MSAAGKRALSGMEAEPAMRFLALAAQRYRRMRPQ